MSFTSLWYFPFLCVSAFIYYFVDIRLKPYFLLALSWFVYVLFGIPHFLLLLFVTLVSYLCGLLTEGREKGKAIVLAAGVTMIAGSLFYIKYLGMFLSLFRTAGLFPAELTFSERNLILPAGISFYTFQSLSYMVDVYRGRKKESSFVKYALYISFFPQLVAGPIEQAGRLIPQLDGRRAKPEDFFAGCRYLMSGCVRKFVIADYMAGFVDRVYGNVVQQSGADLLLATVLFAIQIYCDFSGYTHLAIGSARFLGIRLTENFDRPYLAVGCRDFWKRWHITLTKWFGEYIYIPMARRQSDFFVLGCFFRNLEDRRGVCGEGHTQKKERGDREGRGCLSLAYEIWNFQPGLSLLGTLPQPECAGSDGGVPADCCYGRGNPDVGGRNGTGRSSHKDWDSRPASRHFTRQEKRRKRSDKIRLYCCRAVVFDGGMHSAYV